MTTATATTFVINETNQQEINRWLKKYPPEQKQSALLTALLLVQDQNGGWLSEAAMEAVANYLQLPRIVVYEAATFYDLYNLAPIGKHKISICTNVSCMLRGAEAIVSCVKKRLGINLGETTPDGQFTLREVECMAACTSAPMCQVDDKDYHENLTPEKMTNLINELANRDTVEK